MRVSRHGVAEKVPQATLGSDSPFIQLVTTNTHPSPGTGRLGHPMPRWAGSAHARRSLGRCLRTAVLAGGGPFGTSSLYVFSKLPVECCLRLARWRWGTTALPLPGWLRDLLV